MDYQEINRCLEVLQKKPGWFFQKDDIQKKLGCLQKIEERGTPNDIHFLVPFLVERNECLRQKVADVIVILFRRLKSQNELYERLKYVSIRIDHIYFYETSFSRDISIVLLGIASFNQNGYVRERAVKKLAASQDPHAIRFILFRIGDWVKPVREVAQKAIRTFFSPTNVEVFLKELTTISMLKEVKRIDLSAEYNSIIEFLVSKNISREFYNQLKVSDKSRLLYIRNYLERKGADRYLSQIIMTDRNFLIRKEILKHVSSLDQIEQEDVIKILLGDRSSQVRFSALISTKNYADKFENDTYRLISDESASIRDLARYLLKNKNYNFRETYNKRILRNEILLGSIFGLSEVGLAEDIDTFRELILQNNVQIKLSCLLAFQRLDPLLARTYSTSLLTHSSNKLRGKCIEILAETWDDQILELTKNIYPYCDFERKKTILKLYSMVGGWAVICELILAVSDEDVGIQNIAWDFLQKWKDKSLRLFSTPSEEILTKANDYYNKSQIFNTSLTPSRKRLWEEIKYRLN